MGHNRNHCNAAIFRLSGPLDHFVGSHKLPRHHIDRNCGLGGFDAELEQLAMESEDFEELFGRKALLKPVVANQKSGWFATGI
jgi:hypothetical protein